MCGIVGLYLKKKKLHNKLGFYLSGMLDNMSSRGPDSAGFAIYNNKESKKYYKYSLCLNNTSSSDFEQVIKSAGEIEAFANKMTDYFPVGSVSRGSSENIWSDFEGFTKAAKLNSNAAKTLRIAAQDNKLDELNSLFSELSSTCKSCHRSYKN